MTDGLMSPDSERRFRHFAVLAAVALIVISVFWSFRVRAAQEATEFKPIRAASGFVPAGTPIPAVLRNGIPSSAAKGDRILAVTSEPVLVQGVVAIPTGAQLEGTVNELSSFGSEKELDVRFTELFTGNRSLPIQTKETLVSGRVQSPINAVSGGLGALIETSIGAAFGAASGDPNLVKRGLLEGAGSIGSADSSIPITIVLTGDLEI
jgi:hypothetical protein